MGVQYGNTARPRCECVKHQQPGEPRTCPGIGAVALDAIVGEQVLRPLTPAGIELSLAAAGEIERGRARLDAHGRSDPERAGYESRLAERSDRVADPEDRLVVRALERRWEEALRRQQEARECCDRFAGSPKRLTRDPLDRIRALAADIPPLWDAADTPAAGRKEIVRAPVELICPETRPNRDRDSESPAPGPWIGVIP